MIVTQIVRRFGRVGGMERYVWELVRELLNRNVRIRIICQDYIDELPGVNPGDLLFGASATLEGYVDFSAVSIPTGVPE